MTELSPAARAVLTAVTLTKYDVPPEGLPAFAEEMAPLLAVALRAAADQNCRRASNPVVNHMSDSTIVDYYAALAAQHGGKSPRHLLLKPL
jgi:hypothetical protein